MDFPKDLIQAQVVKLDDKTIGYKVVLRAWPEKGIDQMTLAHYGANEYRTAAECQALARAFRDGMSAMALMLADYKDVFLPIPK